MIVAPSSRKHSTIFGEKEGEEAPVMKEERVGSEILGEVCGRRWERAPYIAASGRARGAAPCERVARTDGTCVVAPSLHRP